MGCGTAGGVLPVTRVMASRNAVNLARWLAALVERRVVVVASGVRFVVGSVAVGAVHKSEAGAAMEHVHADGVALLQHPLVFRGVGGNGGGVVVLAPMIEPAGPVLASHERALRAEFLQRFESLLCIAGAEVDDGGQIGK